ncbi:hypothetical protein ACEU6E_04680 [Halorutilales archaeon Cl-col2-1]
MALVPPVLGIRVCMIISSLNIALLTGLATVYGRNYRRMKSAFSLGLLIFSLLFVLENSLAVYYYVTQQIVTWKPHIVLATSEFVGFSVLGLITWKPDLSFSLRVPRIR